MTFAARDISPCSRYMRIRQLPSMKLNHFGIVAGEGGVG